MVIGMAEASGDSPRSLTGPLPLECLPSSITTGLNGSHIHLWIPFTINRGVRLALRGYKITLVVDVRRFPGSRQNPQFGANALTESLNKYEIAINTLEHLEGDVRNHGWIHRTMSGKTTPSKSTPTTRLLRSSRKHSTNWLRSPNPLSRRSSVLRLFVGAVTGESLPTGFSLVAVRSSTFATRIVPTSTS